MSQRKVARLWVDEGPASVAAIDPLAALSRLALPGAPSGGAGPIERRQISEAEREIRRAASPAQRTWNGAHATKPAPPPEEETVSEPRANIPDPIPGAPDALIALNDAVVVAIEARDAKGITDTAWRIAQCGLAAAWRALPPLDLLDDAPRLDKVEPALADPPLPWPPTQAERDAQSRRNGQASMQAQKRAVEVTSTAAAKAEHRGGKTKGTTGQKRTPEQRETMRQAMLASIARRKAATA